MKTHKYVVKLKFTERFSADSSGADLWPEAETLSFFSAECHVWLLQGRNLTILYSDMSFRYPYIKISSQIYAG